MKGMRGSGGTMTLPAARFWHPALTEHLSCRFEGQRLPAPTCGLPEGLLPRLASRKELTQNREQQPESTQQ
ncbi:hypothetical protein E2C01_045133 [Portunus trituberculatus]|uniref:Uncharacterized protein n=1 Tax=Portunus trituberculatus TaxID=210409 RepID=A0A5B7G188_PORTR|nr:hypothetical protein [Portunus trituberculatus]